MFIYLSVFNIFSYDYLILGEGCSLVNFMADISLSEKGPEQNEYDH